MKTTRILLRPPTTYRSGATSPSVSLQVHLAAMSFFIVGFSGKTRRDLLVTVDFALGLQRNYDVNAGLFAATRQPGTKMEKIFLERGLMKGALTPGTLSKIPRGVSVMDGDAFTADDVREMRETFLRKNIDGGRGQSAMR